MMGGETIFNFTTIQFGDYCFFWKMKRQWKNKWQVSFDRENFANQDLINVYIWIYTWVDTWIGEKLRCFLEFLDSDLIRCLKFSRWRLAQDILKDGGDAVDKLKKPSWESHCFGNLQDILKNGGDTVDKFKNPLENPT